MALQKAAFEAACLNELRSGHLPGGPPIVRAPRKLTRALALTRRSRRHHGHCVLRQAEYLSVEQFFHAVHALLKGRAAVEALLDQDLRGDQEALRLWVAKALDYFDAVASTDDDFAVVVDALVADLLEAATPRWSGAGDDAEPHHQLLLTAPIRRHGPPLAPSPMGAAAA